MPTAMWSLVPRMAASMVAVMSPSAITLIRAPASRISAIRSSCRGRSSTIAVMSPTRLPKASATDSRFSLTERRRSIRPLAVGPTAIFFMYMRGTRVMVSGSPAAITDSAPTPPRATTPGPSMGSSARSSGRPPAPTSTPARRRCPSSARPITTRPVIGSRSSPAAIASLAASSARWPSPRPM